MKMTKEEVIARAKESINIEAKAIADIAGYLDEDSFYEAVKALAAAPRITTCASGSSGIAAKKFAHSLCCIERGAQFLSPAEAVHGGMGCMKKGDVVVMVSRGGKTAELLQCFGCKILAWSRTCYTELESDTFHYVTLDQLMSESDIISLHVPLTTETHHLISAEKLALCKPSAVLINTARGNVVDMNALAFALKENRLAGAGIDVYEKEPPLPQNHELFDAPNCVLVPHVGYATREAFDIRIGIMLDKINEFLK